MSVLFLTPTLNPLPRLPLRVGDAVQKKLTFLAKKTTYYIRPTVLLQSRILTSSYGQHAALSILKVFYNFFFVPILSIFRQLFSIMSYAFVLLNVIVGLFACLARLIKGMVLGLFFLSRLDRTCLMQGFQRWDKGTCFHLLKRKCA